MSLIKFGMTSQAHEFVFFLRTHAIATVIKIHSPLAYDIVHVVITQIAVPVANARAARFSAARRKDLVWQ